MFNPAASRLTTPTPACWLAVPNQRNKPGNNPASEHDRHAYRQPPTEPAPASDWSDEEVLEVTLGFFASHGSDLADRDEGYENRHDEK